MLLILWVWQNLIEFLPFQLACCSMLQVTETGCEVLTARLPSSPDVFPWLKPWWGTPSTATRKWYWYPRSICKNFVLLSINRSKLIFFFSKFPDQKWSAKLLLNSRSNCLSCGIVSGLCVLLKVRFSRSYARRMASWVVSPICHQNLLLISENIVSINLSRSVFTEFKS